MGDGRPRGGSHIENERFWDLPKDSLEYIIKDAGDAMKANPKARKATTGRGNWADQVNDAQTVLGWRRKNGIKEEVELDEAKMSSKQIAALKKAYEPMRGGRLSMDNATKLGNLMDRFDKDKDLLIQLFKADIPFVSKIAMTRLISKHKMKGAELNKLADKDEFYRKMYGESLDEDGHTDVASAIRQCKTVMEDAQQIMSKLQTMSPEDSLPTWWTNKFAVASNSMNKMRDYIVNPLGEEVELDEGKMNQLHQLIKDKKSAEEIAKIMKVDVKTIKTLMNSYNPEEVEEGAAADARRAMRRDKDFSRRDSADDDTDATDDDIKGASKNIMMQMRKAQSLNGRFDVEFADGKKVKIPAKMAMAVQSKYNKMRRPAEKEKFQAKIAKSYRDMLSALKEEVEPKKESVLDRIDRKIKEKNDG